MSGTMNTVQQSTESDPLSPTTLILNYLRSRGVQPTAANVREAVLANAREGNQLGADPIAGLRSDRPATEAEDQAAMRTAGKGGGGKSGSSQPTDPSFPKPGTPTNERPESGVPGSNPVSSAPPASTPAGGGGNDLDIATAALLGIPLAVGGAYGLNKYLNRGGGGGVDVPTDAPFVGGDVRPSSNALELTGPQDAARLQGPPDQLRIGNEANPSQLEMQMQKAIAPPGPEPTLGGVKPYTPDAQALIDPRMQLPPGITDVDAARAGIGRGGLDQPRLQGNVGTPEVNLPPRAVPRQPVGSLRLPLAQGRMLELLRNIR